MTHLRVCITWVESTRAWKGILQSMTKLMLNINTFIQNNFFSNKFRPFKYVLKEPDFSFNSDPWKWWVASSRLLFVFQKSFILAKRKWSAAWFHHISIALNLVYNRNKLFKTLHYWSRDMLNFDHLDKGLGRVSPEHFVHDF